MVNSIASPHNIRYLFDPTQSSLTFFKLRPKSENSILNKLQVIEKLKVVSEGFGFDSKNLFNLTPFKKVVNWINDDVVKFVLIDKTNQKENTYLVDPFELNEFLIHLPELNLGGVKLFYPDLSKTITLEIQSNVKSQKIVCIFDIMTMFRTFPALWKEIPSKLSQKTVSTKEASSCFETVVKFLTNTGESKTLKELKQFKKLYEYSLRQLTEKIIFTEPLLAKTFYRVASLFDRYGRSGLYKNILLLDMKTFKNVDTFIDEKIRVKYESTTDFTYPPFLLDNKYRSFSSLTDFIKKESRMEILEYKTTTLGKITKKNTVKYVKWIDNDTVEVTKERYEQLEKENDPEIHQKNIAKMISELSSKIIGQKKLRIEMKTFANEYEKSRGSSFLKHRNAPIYYNLIKLLSIYEDTYQKNEITFLSILQNKDEYSFIKRKNQKKKSVSFNEETIIQNNSVKFLKETMTLKEIWNTLNPKINS